VSNTPDTANVRLLCKRSQVFRSDPTHCKYRDPRADRWRCRLFLRRRSRPIRQQSRTDRRDHQTRAKAL